MELRTSLSRIGSSCGMQLLLCFTQTSNCACSTTPFPRFLLPFFLLTMVHGKLDPHFLGFRMTGYGALLTKRYGVCLILHYRDMAPYFRHALFPEGVTADIKWRSSLRLQNKRRISFPYSIHSVRRGIRVCWITDLPFKKPYVALDG
jgi:hypothetical protein